MSTRTYGRVIDGLDVDGTPVHAGVYNEHEVRAAAGITMLAGAVVFAYAYFDANYVPLRVVAAAYFVEFVIRVVVGFTYSPVGVLSRWLMRREAPMWVSAKPKRFAWTLATVVSGATAVITNAGITGWLPRTLCLICLTLMWMETSLGICLGCETHGVLVRRGWVEKDRAYEVCTNGACAVPYQGDASVSQPSLVPAGRQG